MRRLVVTLSLLAAGCSPDAGPALTASLSHASMFGQVRIRLSGDVASLGQIEEVAVGGVRVVEVAADSTSVSGMLQGAPRPGPVEVMVRGTRGTALRHGLVEYDPTAGKVPLTWAAFGASLTMGMQSGGLDADSQRNGVAADVARQAGVYLALPLVDPRVLTPLQPQDLQPDCTAKPGTGPSLDTISATLTDPATGLWDLRRGRLDPTLVTRDLAIGGSKVEDILHGGSGRLAVLEHVVEDPDTAGGDAFGREAVSQIQRLEKLDPDVAICTDLLANDLDGSIGESDLQPEAITDLAPVQAGLTEMMARLGRLHGHYFIANVPSLTFVPHVAELRAQRLAAGLDTEASFDAKVQQIDAVTDRYNAALVQAMAPWPNLHLVDFRGEVEMIKQGVRVGGELLTVGKFGGLLSLDHLHFANTGYAVFANLFIRAIDDALGMGIPLVDLEAVHAADPLAPSRLRALGLSCVPPAQ